jgi:hypothetical protein
MRLSAFPQVGGAADVWHGAARHWPRPVRARPVPWCRREAYLAGLTSIFLTSAFFSALRPTETVRMPWS